MPDDGAEPHAGTPKTESSDGPPVVEMVAITIDCRDPGELARFYAAAGGGKVLREAPDSAVASIWGVTLGFRRVDDHQAPSWPSSDVPMQMHFELRVEDLTSAEAALLGLGATRPEYQPPVPDGASPLIVLRDPAGHLFCVFAG